MVQKLCAKTVYKLCCKNCIFCVKKRCCKVMQMNTLRVFPRARVNKQTNEQTNEQNTLRCYGKDV